MYEDFLDQRAGNTDKIVYGMHMAWGPSP